MDIHARLHRARSAPGYIGDPLVQIGQGIRDESKVLCFDEFQVTDIADAIILKRLFGAIWDSGGVMVATSNRHPEKLYERGLNRPLFLPKYGRWRAIWTTGRRQEGGEISEIPVFFTDAEEFEKSLFQATGGVPLQVATIRVMMNRKLHVHVSSRNEGTKSIVKSTFRELCEANLGSADYHPLCKAASIVYISGLRQFQS